MIIVSQDKDMIINFENIAVIEMEDLYDDNSWVRISAETDGQGIILGDYRTDNRAKEILQEIVTNYINDCKSYRMPKE